MYEERLNNCLKKMLDDAKVTVQALPQCPQISLYLLDPKPMQRAFSAEEVARIEHYPAYWAFCWASGQVLAQQILANPEWVAGKKVLDFGAGSGVVAVACALAGAQEVVACDIDPDALLACQANAQLNKVQLRTHGDLFTLNEQFDLLIAADVLYDRANLPLLEVFLKQAQEVLVADSRIKNFAFPCYQKMAEHASFTFPDLDESHEFRKVSLYHGKR